ncbi:substrate-binding domain-containing protein [Variovorax ureilyticus]|uniref:Substrate-binding domain-containing protein n=1 Tax=Variovorax ureilyticus TaxID=1836198 RepID=A0ABU8VRL8_9BURK
MNIHSRRMILKSAAVAASLVVANFAVAADKIYKIAAASFGESAEYMHTWTTEMMAHPWVKNGRVKLVVFDGKFDPLVQANQVDTMITQKFDAIVIAPFDLDASGPPIDRAIAAGIPVIGSALKTKSTKLTSEIIVDDVEGGRLIAVEMSKLLGGKGNIALLEGPIGQSAQLERRRGIDAGMKESPGLKLLVAKSGNWSRAEGQALMENWLSAYPNQINGVLAENDEMALGAIEAMKAKNVNLAKVPVVAIDGIPDGKRAVADGTMTMTLYKYARAEGQGALDLALRALEGPSYKPQSEVWNGLMAWGDGTAKNYTVPWLPLSKSNVAKYKD